MQASSVDCVFSDSDRWWRNGFVMIVHTRHRHSQHNQNNIPIQQETIQQVARESTLDQYFLS